MDKLGMELWCMAGKGTYFKRVLADLRGRQTCSQGCHNLQANAQPKAVMDKICGWSEEENWVGSLFAACMWMYTKHVLCDGQETTQNFFKRKMLSMMESVNWVCEEVLEEHEWVSQLNISLKQEEVLRESDYEIDVLCVVPRRFLWFIAPSRSYMVAEPVR